METSHSMSLVCLTLYHFAIRTCSHLYEHDSCIKYTGGLGRVVYSEGRLIPHQFPITDPQQISGLDGIGRVTCTVSSGTARLIREDGEVESEGLLEAAIAIRGLSDSFQNRAMYCNSNDTSYFYLYIIPSSTGEYKMLSVYIYIYIYIYIYASLCTINVKFH